MNEYDEPETIEQWWLTSLGDVIVWARLRVLPTGNAQVFNAEGQTLHYDDEDNARGALLDADFREFEGLDEDDAAMMGFDLDLVEPPHVEDEEELTPLMTERLRGASI